MEVQPALLGSVVSEWSLGGGDRREEGSDTVELHSLQSHLCPTGIVFFCSVTAKRE